MSSRLPQPIQEVAHRLAKLSLYGAGVNTGVTPGIKSDLAEQNNVSPAETQELTVGLGAMFFGLTARRFARSITATPVNSMLVPPGRLATWMVARAGVLPNSNPIHDAHGIFSVRYGFTKTM